MSDTYATDIDLSNNIDQVMNQINAAKQRARRSSGLVRLVAISKGQGVGKITNAYAAGLRDFGENRVHEALEKQEQLARYHAIRWHMVGHIQSRKTRHLVPGFELIHSVERLKIAKRLNDAALAAQMKLDILLECNVSGESTKQGWPLWRESDWDSSLASIQSVVDFPGLNVIGLMTMAPWTKDSARIRVVFQRLSRLRDYYARHLPGSWKELSMGMTDDFELAIEEGATIVRIGRAIFGAREVKI